METIVLLIIAYILFKLITWYFNNDISSMLTLKDMLIAWGSTLKLSYSYRWWQLLCD